MCRLSLDLFTQSALVEWAQGDTEQMMKSIDEVYNNATCFEDKLRTAHVKSAFLRMTGRVHDAFAHGFQVLEQLGESFPSTPEVGLIVQELLGMKQRLAGLSTSDLTDLDVMKNDQKKNAMRFLEEILIMCYQNQSKYFPLIAIRMVKITLQYGLSKYSCAGKIFFFCCTCLVSYFSSNRVIKYCHVSFYIPVLDYRFRNDCSQLCHGVQ